MTRQHGQTFYFIEGEGFVGEEEIREGLRPFSTGIRAARAASAAPDPERAFRFSRMFPMLPQFRPDPAGLIQLGQAMEETANFTDHRDLPAGFTYFGQFLDHDITFDKTEGMPDTELDPAEIIQGRSPSLDLDSIYGRGPQLEEKQLFEEDQVRLRIGPTVAVGAPNEPEGLILPNDLPRGHNPEKFIEATIGDPRNDENLAVGQTHLAFLKFHNIVVAQLAELGLEGNVLFERARRMVTLHYQWIVLYDFLPRVIDPTILQGVITVGPQFLRAEPGEEPTMPVEFSVAAYRFGHSLIRDSYSWNRNFPAAGLSLLFTFAGVSGNMTGFNALPANWPVDWRRLYDFKDAPGVEPPPALNLARRIDTALALPLKTLPAFQDQQEMATLAVRNLLRGRLLGLPSGQAVAEFLGEPVLSPEQVRQGPHGTLLLEHQFDTQTPLWYYILKEAEVFNDGQRLGPVGSRLVAETFVGLIQGSQHSILAANSDWRPTLPSLRPGQFTMVDLLLLVNDLNPLGAERALPPSPPPPQIYIVKPGDTLSSIAARFLGDARHWRILFDANRDKISNPNIIEPGMELIIPNI